MNRTKYTIEEIENARKYYLMGLNLYEVSKLTDISVRMLKKYRLKYNWKEISKKGNIKERAYDLKQKGSTYDEISDLLKITKRTVFKYVKEIEQLKNS